MNRDFDPSAFGARARHRFQGHRPLRHLSRPGRAWASPDRDYYLQAAFAEKKAAYQAYVEKLLSLENWPDAKAKAAAIVALETAIAEVSWTKAQERDPDATYNPYALADLEKAAPGFPWRSFLEGAGLGVPAKLVVYERTALPKIAAIYAATPVDVLQAWLAFGVADNAAPYLSEALRRRLVRDSRLKRALRPGRAAGALEARRPCGERRRLPGRRPLRQLRQPGLGRGPTLHRSLLPARRLGQGPGAGGRPEDRLRRADQDTSTGSSPATKAEALKKLAAYTVKVGYPDHPRDYSKVVIRDDDLVGDVRRAAEADWAYYVARQNGPVDRQDWGMTPQTNDAYNGSLIDIVFPAVILQPPIFDPSADPAVNYGAVGGVIGHELTHGFDDQGRKYDSKGTLRDWWAPADAKTFEARANMFRAQYSAYEPQLGAHVNGALTMGENIADLGGSTLGLDACITPACTASRPR